MITTEVSLLMVSHISEGIIFARTGTHMRQRRNSAKVGGRGGICYGCYCYAKRSPFEQFCGSAWTNADQDPAFYLNEDPDPGSQTNADPDPGQTFTSQKG